MPPSELSIWERILVPDANQITPEQARYLLGVRFPQTDLDRINELSAKADEGRLAPEERAELDRYSHVGQMLSVLKAKAEASLQVPPTAPCFEVAPGILRSQQAFWRDLPELLKNKSNHGKWVCYHGDEQVGIARTKRELIQECLRRGFKDDEYDFEVIEPRDSPPWEPEEVEDLGPWHFEDIPPEP